jgi:hypothetical protein
MLFNKVMVNSTKINPVPTKYYKNNISPNPLCYKEIKIYAVSVLSALEHMM